MPCIRLAVLPDDLNDAHLQQLVHRRNLVEHLQDVLHGLRHSAVRKEHERVPLARRIGLGRQERLDELGRVGDKVLVLAVDGVHGEDGVLAHVGVSVLEACAASGDKWFEKLDVFRDLLQEAKGRAADVLVGVLL